MFKFGFHENNEDSNEGQEKKDTIQWYPCKVVEIPSNISEIMKNIPKNHIIKVKYGDDLHLKCLSSKEVLNDLKKKSGTESLFDVLEADGKHSDLVAGKYEGGLKVWECTKDLIEYFIGNVVNNDKELKGKNVLDLGCGSGHLGIMALKYGGNVTFQDYNQEVVESLTIPNVFLNVKETDVLSRISFFSGDWGSFLELLNPDVDNNEIEKPAKKVKLKNDLKLDYILSSETIYNKENYQKLYEVLKELMKETGTAFIAAKSYYFGVGGSTLEFRKFVEKEDVFESKICWETSEGVSREIIQIKFKKFNQETEKS